MSDAKSQKRKLGTPSLPSFLSLLSELQNSADFQSVAAANPYLSKLVKSGSLLHRLHLTVSRETSDQVCGMQLEIPRAVDRVYEALEKSKAMKTEEYVVQLAANFCQKRLLENVSFSNRKSSEFLDPVLTCPKKQTKIHHSFQNLTSVENSVQRHLAGVIRSVFSKDDRLSHSSDEVSGIRDHEVGRKLRDRGLLMESTATLLEQGAFQSWEELLDQVTQVFWTEWRAVSGDQGAQWKTLGDEFLEALASCLYTSTKRPNSTSPSIGGLPLSIVANQEPYLDCEWRKEPMEKRPYQTIKSYEVVEEEMLGRLDTSKSDGLSEDFFISHQNFPLDYLKHKESCLINSVRDRTVLSHGQEVLEVDTWGMDCYSRKNIYDSILDAGFDLEETTEWFCHSLLPVINQQGETGWDLKSALEVILRPQDQEDSNGHRMAQAVKERLEKVGEEYFRIHPKGSGVICIKEEGIEAFTLVEEYLGVLHSPWRWFEIQDYLKRRTSDKLPDFYNIILERPRDDPHGYQVSFVDAAAKGTLASRISHSCDPNCQVVVVSVDGRLTIAMYTLRFIQKGEELSFDYSSVTESEKEFRSAICLCSSLNCRGSFLHYAGSTAFMHIMSSKHNFLHRNSILLQAMQEPLDPTDHRILQKYQVKDACLGAQGVDRVPQWLEKWTALILQYVEMEFEQLPTALLEEEVPFDEATSQAKGLRDNRLQNIAITIDKVRMCLQQSAQQDGPPLRVLTEDEVVQHLWTGEKSIARRFLRTFLEVSTSSAKKNQSCEIQVLRRLGKDCNLASKLASILSSEATTMKQAREGLLEAEKALRSESEGNVHTAAADILHLYGHTKTFFTPGSKHKGFTSRPLCINLSSISGASHSKGVTSMNSYDISLEESVCKKYGAHFIWGQLSMWYKQTVNDPTASLSAERRGALSLPDIESCYSRGHLQYHSKERGALLEQLESRPDAMWKVGTIFSFRNESKIYGSPMLDAVYRNKVNLQNIVHYLKDIKPV